MAEQFPVGVPAPLVNPNSYTQPSHITSNDVISGEPRYRQKTSDRPVIFQVSWNLSRNELAVLEGWFKWTLKQGAKSFEIDLETGAGYLPHECYFERGTFGRTRVGKRYVVTASLLAVEMQTLDECDYETLAALLALPCEGEKAGCFYDAFDQFANEILPDYWENLKFGTDYS